MHPSFYLQVKDKVLPITSAADYYAKTTDYWTSGARGFCVCRLSHHHWLMAAPPLCDYKMKSYQNSVQQKT